VTTQRIETLVELGRWREAQLLSESVLAEEPDNYVALGHRTRCLLELDDFPAALASANRMVALEPDDDWAHRMCSIVLDGMGQHDEALRAAAEAVRLDPYDWLNHAQYATAAIDVRGRLGDALDAARRSVELAPNAPHAHFVLGLVAHRRNEVAVAQAAYRRVLQLQPDHAQAINNLAVLDGLHRTVSASRGFATALQIDPQNATVRQNIDALMINFALILFLMAGGGVVVALAAVRDRGPGPAGTTVAVAFTLLLLGYVGWVGWRVPRGVRRYALARWRHRGLAVWNTVLAVLEIAVVYVVCFSPQGEEFGMAALRPVLITLVILGVRTAMSRSSDR
jgi:tetratricopeptide (TPR) repeat protein